MSSHTEPTHYRPNLGVKGLPMFDPIPPYQGGSETSKNAALAVMKKAPTQKRRVLEYIASRGYTGATDKEIAAALDLELSAVCARRNALVREGKVKDSGRRRKGVTGNPKVVWILDIRGQHKEGA